MTAQVAAARSSRTLRRGNWKEGRAGFARRGAFLFLAASAALTFSVPAGAENMAI